MEKVIIGRNIQIAKYNYSELINVKNALIYDINCLCNFIKRMPLEIEFNNYRFVLSSKIELESLIDTLDIKLKAFQVS